jgi:putative nucleotidyltransferase with HDIG domain
MGDLGGGVGAWSAEVDLDQAIADLVARDDVDLPPYPAVALKIERLVGGGDYGLDELARLVQSDQALAADVLRCANSAAFLRGVPVASVPQAVARIGAGELSRIAFASALSGRALSAGPLSLLRRRIWHDAVASAILARELARARGLSPEVAFACGLLHDFGRVLVVECLERIASGARHRRSMPARFWEAVVDHHHVALGRLLADRWQLPRVIADAITMHHLEEPAEAETPELVAVIAVCDRLVRLLDERSAVGEADVLAVQSLSEADTAALLRAIDAVPGFVAAFERDVPPAGRELLEAPAPPPSRAVGGALRLLAASVEYRVTGFAPHQLILSGPAPLPEGALLEVETLEVPPVRFHARIQLCWDEGPHRFGVVLMPFALSGPALMRWQGLAGPARG